MKASRISAIMLLTVCLGVCLELSADMVVLRTSDRLSGRVVGDERGMLRLAYRDGTLAIAGKYVQKVMRVPDPSDYGRKLAAPTDEELSGLAERLIEAARRDAGPPTSDEDKPPAMEAPSLRTVRYHVKEGGWAFSFELPANWEKVETPDALVFAAPGKESWASVCAGVIRNPAVDFETQARLDEAVAGAQLSDFSTIYSATRTGYESELHRHELTGIYGTQPTQSVARIILRRTRTHTFVLTFFASLQAYDQCRPVFSACLFGSKLEKTGD